MKKHSIIIAQVGKGKYSDTTYVKANKLPESVGKIGNDKSVENGEPAELKNVDIPKEERTESKYSFEAVIDTILSENNTSDKMDLILVATVDSYLGSLYNVLSGEGERLGNIDNDIPGIVTEGSDNDKTISLPQIAEKDIRKIYETNLSRNIKKHFNQDMPMGVSLAIINYGINDSQLGDNFEIIRDVVNNVIKNGDEFQAEDEEIDIYFDITNGFRSFPFYIYALINYLQKIEGNKGDKLQYHMYYGMYEAKTSFEDVSKSEDSKKQVEITPLVNLQVIDDLLQLINAVSEFQNCGSVKQILEILLIHREWDIQIGETAVETLSYAFKMFDYGTNANNLAAIEIGINLLAGIENKIDSENRLNDAERLLIKEIACDFSARFGTEESRKSKHYPYSNLMIQLAKWFHETGREGNAAITVQETVLTYLMERYDVQIKEFLLDKQFIGDLDMDGFDVGCDLRDAQYLFEYKLRQPVRLLLKNLKEEENTDISEFYKRYMDIKTNVRDIMAHVVLSEQSVANYETYRSTIKSQIEYLLKEIELAENAADGAIDESNGDAIIERLFSGAEIENMIEEKKEKTLRKIMRGPIDDNAEEDEFTHRCNQLARQMEHMKEITNSNPENGYVVFCRESNQLDLILKCMDMWILDDQGEEVNPKDYYNQYFNKKRPQKPRKSKKGYERLMAYIDGHINSVVSILENKESH